MTTGGTGFGLLALIVAAERGWVTRTQAAQRANQIVNFLWKADVYHGAFPHWLNGRTGHTIHFDIKDDGADIVEMSFLYEGLPCCRQYFTKDMPHKQNLRSKILRMWEGVEWTWFTQGSQHVLYWHWSPNNGWSMNHQIHGWNECLITYVLAASSPKYAIDEAVYDQGWATGPEYKNGKTHYDTKLPLGTELGGPLFLSHYSFMGLDPHGLKDQRAPTTSSRAWPTRSSTTPTAWPTPSITPATALAPGASPPATATRATPPTPPPKTWG